MAEMNSRRAFLRGATGVAVAHSANLFAGEIGAAPDSNQAFAYVGTYTGGVGNQKDGEGIYRFEMNLNTGELSHRTLVARTPSPSWIAIHPSKQYLFAINEVEDFEGHSGSVSSFAIDRSTGALRLINVKSSGGAGPAYMSVDQSGKYIFVANYAGGTVAVLPVSHDGALSAPVCVQRHTGAVGAKHATNAPQGSFAISGHDAPHAHMVLPDPNNRFVLASDLGQDRIYSYQLHENTGQLTPAGDPFVELPSGDGPRHFAFHPNGHWVYSLQEEASTVVFFHYDPATGSLSAQQTVSSLPPEFAGTNFGSEIAIAPSGRALYAANRLHNTIARFEIADDGKLTWAGETWTRGDYPRQFRIDPTGHFVFACNQLSDSVACFRIERGSESLQFTGSYIPVPTPSCITFLV